MHVSSTPYTGNTPAVRPGGVFIRDITTSVVSWPPVDVFDSTSGSLNRSSINQHLVEEDNNLLFPWKVVNVIYDAHDCQRGITLLSVTADGGCGQACVNESQIEEASPPISGTFTIANSNGQITKDIPVTASAAEVKQFLEEIHDGVEFDVTERWRCHRPEWTIEWSSLGGDQDPLVVNHDNLEGVGITSTVVEEVHGGILFRPVRGDMLRQPHPSPQVSPIHCVTIVTVLSQFFCFRVDRLKSLSTKFPPPVAKVIVDSITPVS